MIPLHKHEPLNIPSYYVETSRQEWICNSVSSFPNGSTLFFVPNGSTLFFATLKQLLEVERFGNLLFKPPILRKAYAFKITKTNIIISSNEHYHGYKIYIDGN